MCDVEMFVHHQEENLLKQGLGADWVSTDVLAVGIGVEVVLLAGGSIWA